MRNQRTLFDEFNVDAPHVTEVRRLLQTLARDARTASRKIYLVTSASRGEGKSTISALLALGAARFFRKRTLLIDADLRRASVHQLLGITHRPGLFELLRQATTLEIATRSTALPTLFAIPGGRATGPMSDAYVDEEFAALLRRLRDQYDLILVDAAPIVPVADPLLMAEHADGVLLIAMAGKTPVSILRRMRQLVEPILPKVCGVILNNAAEGLPYYFDYRYYGYESPKPSAIRARRAASSAGASAPKLPRPKEPNSGGPSPE